MAPGSASFMIGNLAQRIEGRHRAGEDGGEQPEAADEDAGDAHAGVEELAVEAEPLLKVKDSAKTMASASQTGQKRHRTPSRIWNQPTNSSCIRPPPTERGCAD
jgi:hypothetical protein